MIVSRGFAHIVGVLSVVVLVGTNVLEFYKWLPIHNVMAADMIGVLVALFGSIYASRKASRWWYFLTGLSIALLILYIIALGV